MPETILLDGVPLGEFTLTDVETHIGPLEPLPGLDAVEDRLWPQSEHLWREGFLGGAKQHLSLEMLAPPPDLSFEVRDEGGHLVAVDFANVVLAHSAEEYPVVIVARKRAMAAVAAVIRPRGRT